MNPITQTWIDRSEEDWICAQREARARKLPSHNAVCFFAQQTAEKYLKARLVEAGIQFKKTHDLEDLLLLVLPIEPGWNVLQNDLKFLNAFSVAYRYPGASATKNDARDAIKSCRHVRKVVRISFGLPI